MADEIEEINAYYNATLVVTLTFSVDGVAVDLSSKTIYFMVKRNLNDADNAALISETILPADIYDADGGIHVLAINRSKCKILGLTWAGCKTVDDQNNAVVYPNFRINFLPAVNQEA